MTRTNASRPVVEGAPEEEGQHEAAARRSAEELATLAKYIADMAAELSQMAGGANMPMLAYFLNLARVEAEMQARERGGVVINRCN